jgi:L-iditol 2-dehydrogenase
MNDLVLEAPRRVRVRPVTRPATSPAAGEVLVAVSRVSLCGSDYRLFTGAYGGPKTYPILFGHEWAGVVIDTGAGSRLPVGASVTGDCSRWCGRCDRCQVDRNLCRHIEKFGITTDGFSARYRLVEDRYLYHDERGLGADLLALTELFAVAAHGIRKVSDDLAAEPEALIVGAGPLGLATALLLRHEYGLRAVHLLESDPGKVEAVRARFPDFDFVAAADSPVDGRELTYGEISAIARYPLVFECCGSAAGLNTGILLAASAGRLVCFGLGRPGPVRTDLVVSKSLTLTGSIGGTGGFPDALDFLARHGQRAARMITHRFPSHRVGEAFETTLEDPSRIKVQIEFGEER